MKKRLAVVLSAIMALTMFGGQFAFAASGDQFTDVPSDAWYKPDVDYVAENDYMIGTSDTTFEPQSNLTRAMFATILARYDGAEVDDSVPTIFTDVEVNQWFTGSIGWANEKKIVEGRGDNIFDPTSFITRQELAVMVERYITYVESTTDKVHVTPGVAIPFTDADQISDYAKDAMDKAVIHGLIIGYPDKSVKPLQNITRAETAAVIHRIKWKTRDGRENYTLTYKDKDGNVLATVDAPVGQLVVVGKDLPNPEAPEGMTFVGWQYTAPDGTVTTYHPGDKIQLSDDMVLIPIFSDGKEAHDITLIDAVDDSEISKTTVPSGETFTIPEGPEKSGYTFKEWNTQKDGKGTTYKPESTIELVSDMTLYAIYTKKSSGGSGGGGTDYYQVTVDVTATQKDENGDNQPYKIKIPLTAVYSMDEGTSTTLDDIAVDLISNITAADNNLYNNENIITNLLQIAVVDKARNGENQFGEGNYNVITDDKGRIHVDEFSVAAKLMEEVGFYKERMKKVRELSGLNSVDNGVWEEYVNALSIEELFKPVADTAPDVYIKDADGYYAAVVRAVKAVSALHKAIGDQKAYEEVLKAQAETNVSPLDVFLGKDYTILGKAPSAYSETQAQTELAKVLAKDNKTVLKDLCTASGNVVFLGKESINSVDDLVTVINERVSRNWTNRDDIKAVLESLFKAYKGDYSVTVTFKKVTK